MKNMILCLVALSAFAFAGCDKSPTKESGTQTHAAATVKPGSHEDWCGEHAVPESQCTRCNSSLIAAF